MTLDLPFLATATDAAQGAWPFLKAAGKFILICIEVLLLFNLLIFVHELGHFLAAKWRGLYVDEFALWFGKPLWRKKIAGVWYAINSIPAGGYVKLPQMADMSQIEGAADDLPPEALVKIKPLDKIIVAFAGPLFSFLLAFTMAVVVWGIGRPESDFDSNIIGYVKKDGPADKAGLKVGDVILSVDGKPVKRFLGTDGVKWAIIRSEGEKIPFVVKRDGKELTIDTGWEKEKTSRLRRPSLRQIQIGPRSNASVGFVTRKSPADLAGIKANDLVVEANNQPVGSLDELDPIVKNFSGKDLPIVVEREVDPEKHVKDRIPLTLNVPATKSDEEGINLGIGWGKIYLTYPEPISQVVDAAMGVFRTIGAVVSRNSDVSVRHLSSPVGILRLYYQVFSAPEGWRAALALSVLINVNLAMLNMLPFPVLDGGHITFAIVEAVRRKPVNPRVMEILQTGCAILLIGFMAFVAFFDIGDLFGGDGKDKSKDKTPPAKESTK